MSIVHAAPSETPAPRRPLPLGGGQRQENAYALACAWTRADPHVRVRRSKQAAAAYKAISLLPAAWGTRLDALGASHSELRWLAGTMGHAYAAAREARYAALLHMLTASDPTETRTRAFARLMAALPKMRGARRPG